MYYIKRNGNQHTAIHTTINPFDNHITFIKYVCMIMHGFVST